MNFIFRSTSIQVATDWIFVVVHYQVFGGFVGAYWDYQKRWHDIIALHTGNSHGYIAMAEALHIIYIYIYIYIYLYVKSLQFCILTFTSLYV